MTLQKSYTFVSATLFASDTKVKARKGTAVTLEADQVTIYTTLEDLNTLTHRALEEINAKKG